ncbi:MAG: hypothetical protein ACRD26_11665 [Vicinamibacterales bacterium]
MLDEILRGSDRLLELPAPVGHDVSVEDGFELRGLAQIRDQNVRRADERVGRQLVAFVEIELNGRVDLSSRRFDLRDELSPDCGP